MVFNCTKFIIHAWIACRFRYLHYAHFKVIYDVVACVFSQQMDKHLLHRGACLRTAQERIKSLIFPRSIQSKFHTLFYPIKLTNSSNWLKTICSISINYPAGLKKYVVYDTFKLFLIGILL